MHISYSYAKLLGETNFQPREFSRSGSKAKDRKEKKRERILQGLGVGPGSATERWPCRKNVRKSFFFVKKKKLPKFFYKKADFRAIFWQGQRLVAEPGPTPSPWSILSSFLIPLIAFHKLRG